MGRAVRQGREKVRPGRDPDRTAEDSLGERTWRSCTCRLIVTMPPILLFLSVNMFASAMYRGLLVLHMHARSAGENIACPLRGLSVSHDLIGTGTVDRPGIGNIDPYVVLATPSVRCFSFMKLMY
jgi:hypothetical protein